METDNNNNQEAKHAVYFCFDNNDSSISSFIKYLRATFSRQGIYELKDENDLSNLIIIRVLVVVFSRNYTFYVPENIRNHLNNKDLVVVPVLHGVTESSVTQQIVQLESWSRDLLKSAVLPGYIYSDERSESKFMEEIARDVFEKLYPTEELGIHKRQLDIEKLLRKQPWGLRTLVIFGEHGIGKTTLARAIFRRMSSGYDASCFIKDFHKEFSKEGITLFDEYLNKIPMESFYLSSSASEPTHRQKRVLITLDDVQNYKAVEAVLGSGFGSGSLIIIISSNKEVLDHCNVNEIYELQGLNQEDALKLFTRCAFGKDVTKQNLSDNLMKKIETANGNPSTIREHANKTKEESKTLNNHDASTTAHESSGCDVENNTSMCIIPYEGYPSSDTALPSSRNVGLVLSLMKDFSNSTSHVINLVKRKISIKNKFSICIVGFLVLGCLWNFQNRLLLWVFVYYYYVCHKLFF